MKRYWKKTTALLLALALFSAAIMIPACAVDSRSSLYLSYYRAWLTPMDDAKVAVNIDVQAVDDMDDIGATKVVIWESADGGDTWTDVRAYISALRPELIQHGTYWYYETPIYHQGTAGYKYYAVVTVYAGDSTGSDSREYQTTTVLARN